MKPPRPPSSLGGERKARLGSVVVCCVMWRKPKITEALVFLWVVAALAHRVCSSRMRKDGIPLW